MRHIINLADETVAKLESDGYELSNISFISLYDEGINMGEFFSYAKHTSYNPGYGIAEIPPFIIRMDDGSWYERGEYDGSEWWKHVTVPERPTTYAHINELASWEYPEFFADALYEDELRQFHDEYMDDLCDEIEGELDRPTESGKWSDARGKCATKSRCQRHAYSERRLERGGGSWSKHNSRCWKDQRGKGKSKRVTQHRAA